ncbi:hypothetical protein B9Z55_021877 [Caenorhabditis nigoni]|uniref:Uncharacterized protein n=1 Tax=Caenorhabditis nigoni TaxID=1611254 RepID=A0A2G5TU00_9PELO|nr:hypothetical protein B9Z55_021877 [Caenorhabditis nigoni]
MIETKEDSTGNIGAVFQWGHRLLSEKSLDQNDVCTLQEILSMVYGMKPFRKIAPWTVEEETATSDGVFICHDRERADFYLLSNKCGIIW